MVSSGILIYMKRFWKIYKILAICIFSLVLIDASIVFGFSLVKRIPQKADAGIVLGAAIYTPALYNRSLEGLFLYEQGNVSTLVLSGGRISDKDISEAQYMQKVILKNSTSSVETILEQNSHNTFENIYNSKKLIPQAKSVVIVSDRFHIARAVLLAKRAGFEEVYWSWPKPVYYRKSELAFYYVREMLAMISYVPKFILGK